MCFIFCAFACFLCFLPNSPDNKHQVFRFEQGFESFQNVSEVAVIVRVFINVQKNMFLKQTPSFERCPEMFIFVFAFFRT